MKKTLSLLSIFTLFILCARSQTTSSEWTWVNGDNSTNQVGTYGTLGVPNSNNKPGARVASSTWADPSNNLWLFGGTGYGTTATSGQLNDVWRYDPISDQWTWIKGNASTNGLGSYGTFGVANSTNTPGAREGAAICRDALGNLWLFGGAGYGSSGGSGALSDLWKYDISTNQWVCFGGDITINNSGIYGTQGISSSANKPGGRGDAQSWIDNSGNFWLFGGYGYGAGASPFFLNDLWKYDPTVNQWTWIKGSNNSGQTGVYGTKGIGGPSNTPGARNNTTSWKDAAGNLWTFSGFGYAASGGASRLNDLWKYDITNNQWIWINGDNTTNQLGIYGSLNTFSSANKPGGRAGSFCWTDASNKFWVFGGIGFGESGSEGALNDLWNYDPAINQWVWVKGAKTTNGVGVYGVRGQSASSNKPGGRERGGSKMVTGNTLWLFGGGGYAASGATGNLNDLWKFGDRIVMGNEPGEALHFDGADDYVDVNNFSNVNANYSIETWFRNTGGTGFQNIVALLGTNSGQAEQVLIGTQPDGKLRYGKFDYAAASYFTLSGTTDVRDGLWHHVAVSTSGDNSFLYVDGELQASGSSAPNNTAQAFTQFVRIGAQVQAHNFTISAEHFTGEIDEVRIWNTARTSNEITQLRSCELAGTESGLLAYYKFNQGVASSNNAGETILTDETANGKNGTLNNFALIGSTSNWIEPGGVASGVSCGPLNLTEINVLGNNTDITDGDNSPSAADHTDFGNVNIDGSMERVFTIQNTGANDLTVGAITFAGANSDQFTAGSLTPASPITPGNSATFTVTFTPTSSGQKNATINIANNDFDENPYDFAIKGTATYPSNIRYVTQTGSGTKSGSSWSNAYGELEFQPNLNSATSGVEFWVAAGTYKPTNTTTRTISFTIPSQVSVYGGFAGSETIRTERNPTTNVTVLSGDIGTSTVVTDNSYHVVNISSKYSITLDGFTIRDGYADAASPNERGAGIYLLSSNGIILNALKVTNNEAKGTTTTDGNGGGLCIESSPSPNTIQNSILQFNKANYYGGGVYTMTSARPTFTNCNFTSNSARFGGAIKIDAGSTTSITKCTFKNNMASGGAIHSARAINISKSYFYNNSAPNNTAVSGGGEGGAFLSVLGTTTFTNCVLANNSADGANDNGGGAVLVTGTSVVNLTNCTLSGNTTSSTIKPNGNGISVMPGRTVNLKNTIVWGTNAKQINNDGTINYTNSLVKGEALTTPNSSSDPLFLNSADSDGADNIFASSDDGLLILASSPAKDAGTGTGAPVDDVVGTTRPQATTIDMGAYELPLSSSAPNDYYRSITTGDWNASGTWESATDAGFTTGVIRPATLSPDFNSNDISIETSHTVTVTADVTIDQTMVTSRGIIVIDPGVTLSVNDGTGADLVVDGSVDGAGNMTIKSTAAGTASVGNSSGSISVASTVERYIPDNGHRAWRALSVPVTGTQTIKDAWQEGGAAVNNKGTWITSNLYPTATGFDGSSNSPSILIHDQGGVSGPSWETIPVPNTDVTRLDSRSAWMLFVRGDRNATPANSLRDVTTLRSTGTLKQGPQFPVSVSSIGTGYTFVANPYASPIDIDPILLNTTYLDQQFYIWDAHLTGVNGVGGFRLIERNGGTYRQTPQPMGGSGTSADDPTLRYIHSGQAFFLKATNAVNSNPAQVVFTEAHKTASTSIISPFRETNFQPELLTNLMRVDANNNAALTDGIRVRFDNTYSASVTGEDAVKMNNFSNNLGMRRNNKMLIVEKRPEIIHNDTIFLNLANTTSGNYRLQIGAKNMPSTLMAYLADKYLNTQTAIDLSNITTVDFSTISAATGSYAADRFMIVFKTATTLPITMSSVKAYQKESNIAVEWKVQNESGIKHYEVEKSADGRTFGKTITKTATGNNNSTVNYNWLDVNAVTGNNYYRIRSVGLNGQVTYSQVMKVTIGKGKAGYEVYPNPVTGNIINLQFINQQKGTYIARLINTLGQVMLSKQIAHEQGSSTEAIAVSSNIQKGHYVLEVIAPDKSKQSIKIIY